MIEPTETESKETLDECVAAIRQVVQEAHNDPDLVRHAPHDTANTRPDEGPRRAPSRACHRPPLPTIADWGEAIGGQYDRSKPCNR